MFPVIDTVPSHGVRFLFIDNGSSHGMRFPVMATRSQPWFEVLRENVSSPEMKVLVMV